MDIKESYQVLELEIGATRSALDAAFFRLIERWHPDRAAPAGPEAVREAQRMVQAINDAYQTLAKIVSTSAGPTAAAPARPVLRDLGEGSSKAEGPATEARPKRPVLPASPPAPSRLPPPSPPSLTAPAPAAAASTPASAPPVVRSPGEGGTKAEGSAPTPNPGAAAPETSAWPVLSSLGEGGSEVEEDAEKPTAFSDLRRKAVFYYEMLFPLDSPRRRYGPVILAAALLFFLLLGKCAISAVFTPSPAQQKAAAAAQITQPTGRLVVKSNLASTTIEATRLPAPGATATASINGSDEGAAEQSLAALPPGKYILTARAAGWPDLRQEVSVEAERTTEAAVHFQSGSLRLDSEPSGATVRQGTKALGKTPLLLPQLPPGECQLSLEYPTWPVVAFKTTIAEDVESTGSVRLPHGKLTVESNPPGAKVLLGKRTLGQTPLTLEHFPAGTRKLTLQAKDFPPLEVAVTVEDRGEVKISPALASGFPVLDPAALLRAVWVPDNPNQIAPPHEGIIGPFQPKNDIVRNLNRKRLYENWLRQRYCFTAIIKSYDRGTGQIEFAEDKSELSKYRVLAQLSPEARNDPNLAAQLAKGATFALYGRLSAVEEPRWPFKLITFEFSAAEPLR